MSSEVCKSPIRDFLSKNQSLYQQAKRLIPGGTQLLAKRPERFAPEYWPAYYSEAAGCDIIDLDGRRYLDMSTMGIGCCLLGYADPEVTDAVIDRVRRGSMCSLNCPEEVELAELLLSLHPWAENVRYARTGGEAMAMAVRISRASLKRDLVAFCGYHGWHDWYLAANLAGQGKQDVLRYHHLPGLCPDGVPSQLAGTTLHFRYNKIDDLARIVRDSGNHLAAIVMEPTRRSHPAPGFLEGVRELANRAGAVLVFDEITIGWRLCLGGAHLRYDIAPDIAVFAKALGSGHPMAAVIGRGRVMQAAQESFISSTYWTEGVGPVAALATIRKMARIDVPSYVAGIGQRWQEGVAKLAATHGIPASVTGHPCIATIEFDHPDSLSLQTLLTRRLLDRGILSGTGFYASLAHTPEHVDRYLEAADNVFAELAAAIVKNDAAERIHGLTRQDGFVRLV